MAVVGPASGGWFVSLMTCTVRVSPNPVVNPNWSRPSLRCTASGSTGPRPMWDVHLLDGLVDNRFALYAKFIIHWSTASERSASCRPLFLLIPTRGVFRRYGPITPWNTRPAPGRSAAETVFASFRPPSRRSSPTTHGYRPPGHIQRQHQR